MCNSGHLPERGINLDSAWHVWSLLPPTLASKLKSDNTAEFWASFRCLKCSGNTYHLMSTGHSRQNASACPFQASLRYPAISAPPRRTSTINTTEINHTTKSKSTLRLSFSYMSTRNTISPPITNPVDPPIPITTTDPGRKSSKGKYGMWRIPRLVTLWLEWLAGSR